MQDKYYHKNDAAHRKILFVNLRALDIYFGLKSSAS